MGLLWPFRKRVTEAEEVSQLDCVDSGNKLQRRKEETLGDRFRGLAWGKLLLPFALLVASLLGTLEQGCQTHFHRGPHQPCSSLQRAECNFRTV